MDIDLRKNPLDLHYTRNLQYKNTTIMVLFTYIIGILIAFLTKQLTLAAIDMLFVSMLSITVICVGILFLNEFNYHLKRIPGEIKKLNNQAWTI
jgi:hypothetical protein